LNAATKQQSLVSIVTLMHKISVYFDTSCKSSFYLKKVLG